MAFNTLGSMFFSIPIAGYAIGIIILVPLHAFNLGIGVLGAYVHNARLQFLEFYGKFYEGGGRPFSPMGETTQPRESYRYRKLSVQEIAAAPTAPRNDT